MSTEGRNYDAMTEEVTLKALKKMKWKPLGLMGLLASFLKNKTRPWSNNHCKLEKLNKKILQD